ncbi:MAG: ankyrin repeat domain-containing protein, partial [Planctomycetes bacterium]|nr:ankyrin repeat domain-containing protein [Planctomycetota bacterium]
MNGDRNVSSRTPYRWLLAGVVGWFAAHGAVTAGPIHEAARVGDVNSVYRELLRGIHVDHRDQTGATALHIAAQHGQGACVEYLLRAKADLNTVTDRGYTPLMAAAGNGSLGCLRHLLRAGAPLEATCDTGGTALSVAAWSGRSNCLKELLAAGAAGHVKDRRGYTPLMLGAMTDVACVNVLLEHHADIHART